MRRKHTTKKGYRQQRIVPLSLLLLLSQHLLDDRIPTTVGSLSVVPSFQTPFFITRSRTTNHRFHPLCSKNKEDEYFVDRLLSETPNSSSSSSSGSPEEYQLEQCTHMIGIPLESNHDLLLELESVQRAVLYHCPLLIDAVLSPSITRMPLLLVDTGTNGETLPNDNTIRNPFEDDAGSSAMLSSPSGSEDMLTSRDPITQELHRIVNDVVRSVLFRPTRDPSSSVGNDDGDGADGERGRDGPNADSDSDSDSAPPLLLRFRGLEVDGDDHNVLYTVGEDGDTCDERSGVLRTVVEEIASQIRQRGWNVVLPPDNPQMRTTTTQATIGSTTTGSTPNDEHAASVLPETWRPRVPFMRLPYNFYETLPDPKGLDGNWETYSPEEKEAYVRFPEEGGNGISPIFWYRWWDDVLCDGKDVRMREIAVYGRTGPFGATERAFYVPHLRTVLPDGNAQLQLEEQKSMEYDAIRQRERERTAVEEEQRVARGDGGGDGGGLPDTASLEEDLRKNRSGADRRMLQTIFDSSPDFEVGIDEVAVNGGAESDGDADNVTDRVEAVGVTEKKDNGNQDTRQPDSDEPPVMQDGARVDATVGDDSIDTVDVPVDNTINEAASPSSSSNQNDRVARIIDSISKPVATGDWSKLPRRKAADRPSPENNPIFQKFRKYGTITPPTTTTSSNTWDDGTGRPREVRRKMSERAPFPSDEYFVGIWRLQSTPSGPSVDERRLLGLTEGMDQTTSENLILRADGLTAGGPILDSSNGQRAAGGTWRFFQAEWVGPESEGGAEQNDERRITTRLSIRLVIPPKKDKVMVMEGEVKRGTLTSATSTLEDNMREMRSQSLSSSVTDASLSSQRNTEEEPETFLQCTGEVWVEDAVPATPGAKKNRSRLGRFSLIKTKERNPNEYVYTIPAPRKYQD